MQNDSLEPQDLEPDPDPKYYEHAVSGVDPGSLYDDTDPQPCFVEEMKSLPRSSVFRRQKYAGGKGFYFKVKAFWA